jgi:hypothetical protein
MIGFTPSRHGCGPKFSDEGTRGYERGSFQQQSIHYPGTMVKKLFLEDGKKVSAKPHDHASRLRRE